MLEISLLAEQALLGLSTQELLEAEQASRELAQLALELQAEQVALVEAEAALQVPVLAAEAETASSTYITNNYLHLIKLNSTEETHDSN